MTPHREIARRGPTHVRNVVSGQAFEVGHAQRQHGVDAPAPLRELLQKPILAAEKRALAKGATKIAEVARRLAGERRRKAKTRRDAVVDFARREVIDEAHAGLIDEGEPLDGFAHVAAPSGKRSSQSTRTSEDGR